MKSYGRRVAVAIDQLLNALFGGDEDETISSRAEKARRKGRRWGCVLPSAGLARSQPLRKFN